jgi:hypothetical protein
LSAWYDEAQVSLGVCTRDFHRELGIDNYGRIRHRGPRGQHAQLITALQLQSPRFRRPTNADVRLRAHYGQCRQSRANDIEKLVTTSKHLVFGQCIRNTDDGTGRVGRPKWLGAGFCQTTAHPKNDRLVYECNSARDGPSDKSTSSHGMSPTRRLASLKNSVGKQLN